MKRYVAELIGTFFLALAIVFTSSPLAIGLMMMAMVYMVGSVSGANCNSAVSLAHTLRGKLPQRDFWPYAIAQIVGALVAAGLFHLVSATYYVPRLTPGLSVPVNALLEALLTGVFCAVILMVGTRYKDDHASGLIIGLTLTAIFFLGGVFNPSIALGSIIYAGVLGAMIPTVPELVVYVLAPLAGAFGAYCLYRYLDK